MISCAAALFVLVAAFDNDGNTVIEPKIADNSSSFFITIPLFRLFILQMQERRSNTASESTSIPANTVPFWCVNLVV